MGYELLSKSRESCRDLAEAHLAKDSGILIKVLSFWRICVVGLISHLCISPASFQVAYYPPHTHSSRSFLLSDYFLFPSQFFCLRCKPHQRALIKSNSRKDKHTNGHKKLCVCALRCTRQSVHRKKNIIYIYGAKMPSTKKNYKNKILNRGNMNRKLYFLRNYFIQ